MPVYSDFLLAPAPGENPSLVGTTLPSYNTRDSRLSWPFSVRCDSCPRAFDNWFPGDTPFGAFIFSCPENCGIDVINGLPAHQCRTRALREKKWNARFECTYCLAITYDRSMEEVKDLLVAASEDLVPPMAHAYHGAAPAHARGRGRRPERATGRARTSSRWGQLAGASPPQARDEP